MSDAFAREISEAVGVSNTASNNSSRGLMGGGGGRATREDSGAYRPPGQDRDNDSLFILPIRVVFAGFTPPLRIGGYRFVYPTIRNICAKGDLRLVSKSRYISPRNHSGDSRTPVLSGQMHIPR